MGWVRMLHHQLTTLFIPPVPWPPAHQRVPILLAPSCCRAGRQRGERGEGRRKWTSQLGNTRGSDICQTLMLLLIKSRGQFAAHRHPCFPHLPAAGGQTSSPSSGAFASHRAGDTGGWIPSFPFQSQWTAEQGGKAKILIFIYFLCGICQHLMMQNWTVSPGQHQHGCNMHPAAYG